MAAQFLFGHFARIVARKATLAEFGPAGPIRRRNHYPTSERGKRTSRSPAPPPPMPYSYGRLLCKLLACHEGLLAKAAAQVSEQNQYSELP